MISVFAGLSQHGPQCIFVASNGVLLRTLPDQEDAMSNVSYVSDKTTKTGLRPSAQAIRRAALALAVTLGVAGIADLAYGYLTTGRYLVTTDDAYVKADSTIIAPKVSGYVSEVLV